MKLLIDENLPRKFTGHLTHKCRTVWECGWAGKKSGELVAPVDGEFDTLFTLDKSSKFRQNGGHVCLPFGVRVGDNSMSVSSAQMLAAHDGGGVVTAKAFRDGIVLAGSAAERSSDRTAPGARVGVRRSANIKSGNP